MKKSLSLFLGIWFSFFAFKGFSQPDTVRFLPHWLHQAQFSGYYMAKEKGFYMDAGLYVDILFGGPDHTTYMCIENNSADFYSHFLSGAIEAYDKGYENINICQLSQRSALMYVSKRSSGLEHPSDFIGKKIAIWNAGFRELPLIFLKKRNIDAEIIPIKSTINLFLKGGIDVMCVMWYNEFHQILNAGINEDELNAFHFSDYGMNYPEDGIYCRRDYYMENQDVCRRFIEATLKGWQYAFENKQETVAVVIGYMNRFNIPANHAHQSWMLNRMQDVMLTNGSTMMTGSLNLYQYQEVGKTMLEYGCISKIPDYERFYVETFKPRN